MCGILGWINPALAEAASSTGLAEPALEALRSRGPDAQRVQTGPGWILGHTRLAVIDLSERASQPMSDGHGRWLVYNGEIYNFRELREELRAHGFSFKSDGDAEVLLHALRHWGTGCLERLRGMFAFGLLDTDRRELILARDRYGVKPLAYEAHDAEFRFASDLFALRALPNGRREVDAEAAYLYLALGYVPAPHAIHRGMRKVRPGHWMRVRWSDAGVTQIEERPYWSIAPSSENGDGPQPQDASPAEDALPEFERRAGEAVGYRLLSDVPLGTLLSGGIDSTLVTVLSREVGAAAPTFTMGFEDPAYDETPFARAIAMHLGGSHTEFRMSDPQVEDAWNGLWRAYDEPFADASALPTLALARSVSTHVRVVLSGDGGDEVFCGYDWHHALDRYDSLWRRRRSDPAGADRVARFLAGHGISPDSAVDRVVLWTALRTGLSDGTARLLPIADPDSHPALSDYFREWSRELGDVTGCLDWAGRMDLLTYLPDDLMVKADRASMSVGLELREPLLDHELTAWCLGRPLDIRYDRQRGVSKVLARRALERRLPRLLLERPKQGFTPPLASWLAGPLSEAVEDALERLRRGGLGPLELPPGCRTWKDCASALGDRGKHFLWRLVCFSAWLRNVPLHSGREKR